MKLFQIIALVLVTFPSVGQSPIKTSIEAVTTAEEAEQFVRDHPQLQPIVEIHNSDNDTTDIDRQLYKLKAGSVLSIGTHTYKVINDTIKCAFRASYIYLNGSSLSLSAIDSLRKLIMHRYSSGESFEKLADEFNMDGNKRHGDIGYFVPGMMVKKFEEAVRSHAEGDIFTVDIPDNQWYYVVKKTAPNKITKELTVLRVNG